MGTPNRWEAARKRSCIVHSGWTSSAESHKIGAGRVSVHDSPVRVASATSTATGYTKVSGVRTFPVSEGAVPEESSVLPKMAVKDERFQRFVHRRSRW